MTDCILHSLIKVVGVCWNREIMSEGKPIRVGARVEVGVKGVLGTVAYIGTTLFSSGNIRLVVEFLDVVQCGS